MAESPRLRAGAGLGRLPTSIVVAGSAGSQRGRAMKFNIVVDCTPEEARHFLGLPDVAPMQKQVMEAMEKRLVDAIAATDTATLIEQWMPLQIKGLEQWQAMWSQLAAAAAGMPGKAKRGGER